MLSIDTMPVNKKPVSANVFAYNEYVRRKVHSAYNPWLSHETVTWYVNRYSHTHYTLNVRIRKPT